MIVRIRGCRDLKIKKELKKATIFYASQLLSKKMLPYIKIDVVMKTYTKDLGSCMVTFNNDNYKPREFEIELKRHRCLSGTLKTLAHEMVHVKQLAKGELNDDHTRWQGKKINSDKIDYMDLPWEAEAFFCEYILYKTYKESRE